MTTMLAYRGFLGEPLQRLVQAEGPTVGDHDVLVGIKSAGLTAGTFTLQKVGMPKPRPMTVGHEGASVVEADGREVTAPKPGDSVRIHPTMSCGQCRWCLSRRVQMCCGPAMMGFVSFGAAVPEFALYRNGFIAEYALAPAYQIDKLPDNVSSEAGAKVHYLGNAMRNLRVADLPPGNTLGILGPTGSMGVATIMLAPLFGVRRLVLIGRSSSRLEEVKALSTVPVEIVATDAMGEDWAGSGVLPRCIAQVVPDGMDAIIGYAPEGGAMLQATAGLVTGGALVNMGDGPQPFGLPVRALVGKCWNVVGTRNRSRLDAKECLRLLADRVIDLGELITHRRPLAETDQAVATLHSRDETLSDALAALAAAREEAPGIVRSAAIGHCFGGGVTYRLAVRNAVDAGIAYSSLVGASGRRRNGADAGLRLYEGRRVGAGSGISRRLYCSQLQTAACRPSARDPTLSFGRRRRCVRSHQSPADRPVVEPVDRIIA